MTTAIGIAGVRRFRPAAVGTLAALIATLSVVMTTLARRALVAGVGG